MRDQDGKTVYVTPVHAGMGTYAYRSELFAAYTFQLKLYLHEERVNGKGFPLGAERNPVFSTHCRTLSCSSIRQTNVKR